MATKGKAAKDPNKTGGGKLGSTTKKSWTVDSTNPDRAFKDHWEGKGSTKGKKNDGINALGSPAYNMSNQNKFGKKAAKTGTKSNPKGK